MTIALSLVVIWSAGVLIARRTTAWGLEWPRRPRTNVRLLASWPAVLLVSVLAWLSDWESA